MTDLRKYVGIPFKPRGRDRTGCDCWGIFRLFYKDEFGIELPSYVNDYESIDNHKKIYSLISKGTEEKWKQIELGKEQFGDGILFRIMGYPMHVGIIIKKRLFLHVFKGTDSVLEYYDNLIWRKRIAGIFRYEQ